MASILNFNPPIIGHRGVGYAPENTMSAFVKAIQMGLTWIEFDVMQAACGEPIIFHDESLQRTTNSKGRVAHYPYSYLRMLDAGSWFDPRFAGETIPNLKQVICFLQENKIAMNLELKPLTGQEKKLVDRVLKDLQHNSLQSILFSSFSTKTLSYLRSRSADCLIGLLMHDWLNDWDQISLSLACSSVHVNQEILNLQKAHEIKQAGYQLLSYTVNDALRAQELFSYGVDAVFSDYPDRILGGE